MTKLLKKRIPYLLILILIALPLVFSRINQDFLLFTDELILEEVSFRMAQTGDLATPIFQNRIFLGKPPLYYWLTAPLYKILPPLPLVRRLWTALFSLLLAAAVFLFGRLFLTPFESWLAGLVILTNYLFLSLSKTSSPDIVATFFITLVFYFYLRGKKKTIFYPILGITFGLAFLSRSFLALAPLPVIGLDLIFIKRKKERKELVVPLLASLILALAIILPWHLKMALSFPKQFLNQYFLLNTWARFNPASEIKKILLVPNPFTCLVSFLLVSPIFFSLPIILIKKRFGLKNPSQPESLLIFWVLILALPLLITGNINFWHLTQFLPAFSLLSISLFTCLIKKAKQKGNQFRFLFLTAFLITNFLLGPILFFQTKDPTLGVIKIQKIAADHSSPEETIYSWRFNYLCQNLFFRPRSVAVANPENLDQFLKEKGEIILFIPKIQIEEIKKGILIEEIASLKDAFLLRLSYSK
jgi:4-amino-4-deoxy-L-arabinose transferase-like glycosyltransferase